MTGYGEWKLQGHTSRFVAWIQGVLKMAWRVRGQGAFLCGFDSLLVRLGLRCSISSSDLLLYLVEVASLASCSQTLIYMDCQV